MMKPWVKEGLWQGTRFMGFFFIVSSVWALVIYLSNQAGISPGWAMLVMLTIGVYSLSIATEKLKHETITKKEEK